MNRSIKVTAPELQAARSASRMTVEPIVFERSDWVPNNPRLPVLIYRSALPQDQDAAAEFERRFSGNGWQGLWRDGIFDYQHYHTGAHEVLGIAGGRARLLIGGPTGQEISVTAGDCLVLPAGTGHKRIDASRDFLVVGAYPPSQYADIRTEAPTEHQVEKIATVSLPQTDPVDGLEGPLLRFWSAGR